MFAVNTEMASSNTGNKVNPIITEVTDSNIYYRDRTNLDDCEFGSTSDRLLFIGDQKSFRYYDNKFTSIYMD